MIQLEDIFQNFFADEKITTERLKAFAQDNVSRLTANNPGSVYNSIITATNTRITELDTAITARASDAGAQTGSVFTKDAARAAFQDYISRKEGLVKSTFGKPSAQYNEFFPQGLSAFHKATDEEFLNLAQTAVEKATTYETELGATFKTELTALFNAYKDALEATIDSKGETSDAQTDERLATYNLQIQLVTNVHTVALQNIEQGELALTYFNQSLLFAQQRKHLYKGELAANESKEVCTFEYGTGKSFRIKNKGAQAFTVQMKFNGALVGNAFTVASGKELEKTFPDFYTVGNALQISSTGTLPGEYYIEELS